MIKNDTKGLTMVAVLLKGFESECFTLESCSAQLIVTQLVFARNALSGRRKVTREKVMIGIFFYKYLLLVFNFSCPKNTMFET